MKTASQASAAEPLEPAPAAPEEAAAPSFMRTSPKTGDSEIFEISEDSQEEAGVTQEPGEENSKGTDLHLEKGVKDQLRQIYGDHEPGADVEVLEKEEHNPLPPPEPANPPRQG